jgi:hypothetical protein
MERIFSSIIFTMMKMVRALLPISSHTFKGATGWDVQMHESYVVIVSTAGTKVADLCQQTGL